MKCKAGDAVCIAIGRTPHGVRGLKLLSVRALYANALSHPAWGAWIEMTRSRADSTPSPVAPRMGCVD